MSRNQKAWKLTALIALNLLILILISLVGALRADAVCLGSSGERVAAVQRRLKENGLYDGAISGNCDFATRKAIKAFQRQNGREQSGEADYETLSSLGLSSQTDNCFSVEAELLAKYIRLSDASSYPDMLKAGEELLEKAGTMPLGQYILSNDKNFYKKIFAADPTSECYSCALHALRKAR